MGKPDKSPVDHEENFGSDAGKNRIIFF